METKFTVIKKNKKSGCLKWIIISIAVLALLVIVKKISPKPSNSEIYKSKQIKKEDLRKFSELNGKEKREKLDSFISGKNGFESKTFLTNAAINEAILKSLKYPETLEIKGFDNKYHKDFEKYTLLKESVSNVNYDKGTFDVIREFKAEGTAVGMSFRKTAKFNMRFNGFTAVIDDLQVQ